MSRGPCTFRQRDLKAAIKAARDAGCEEVRVVFEPDGRMVVETSKSPSPLKASNRNEWDDAR